MAQRRISKWVAGVACVVALGVSVAWAADLWGRLGITEERAKTDSVQALARGSVPFYGVAKAVMSTAPAARAALVIEGLTWVKGFAASAEFKKAYAGIREDNKPDAPTAKGSPDDQAKAQDAETRRNIEEARKMLAMLPPDQRKQAEDMLKQMEADAKKNAADPKMQELGRQMAAEGEKQAQQDYKARVADWERDYPADSSVAVANRLRTFLETCGDVDFNAKLVGRNGKMYFADERVQSKSSEWKLCFRAGRETTDAARTFARNWLGELTKK
jgi:hypothetical protein